MNTVIRGPLFTHRGGPFCIEKLKGGMLLSPSIHVISTGKQTIEQFSQIASRIHEYVDFIHVREKERSAKEIAEIIHLLIEKGVPLRKIVVNDRVDVAAVMSVKGVQLAYHSLQVSEVKKAFPGLQIGKSVHSLEEAIEAQQQGADYVLFGHIFATASKPDLYPRGITQLKQLVEQVDIPVVAIGGITPNNTAEVIRAGASGIAVMSGILQAEDPLAVVKTYRERIEEVHSANAI